MILKGSQRSGGQNLAAHLLNINDNDHVRLHELRGFASRDLKGAFKEAEAVARGTKCRQYLFSLSFSPPSSESVTVEQFEEAIGRAETKLGLDGQPRAIVFHEKEGRRHAHCVWSRIDAQTMTARQMSFFKTKLSGLSRELYLEHGWKMPRGLENAAERNPVNFTLAEWQQAKRQDIDPRWLKSTLQDCWQRSDSATALNQALQERGFFLARGDRRSHVVLDHRGEVWSLPRMLGLKTKDVRDRLGDGENLGTVEDAKKQIAEKMTPALRRHVEESRADFKERDSQLKNYRAEMVRLQRKVRDTLESQHAQEWQAETRARAERLPKGLRGLLARLTGTYKKIKSQNEAEAKATSERQAVERQKLIEQHLKQRAVLREREQELRQQQAERLSALRSDIGRYLTMGRSEPPRRDRGESRRKSEGRADRSASTSLKLTR
ncbi:relaxase [Devosia limi DSM 17137]|nr:relaxase [Devosia limi DSM 17137]